MLFIVPFEKSWYHSKEYFHCRIKLSQEVSLSFILPFGILFMRFTGDIGTPCDYSF